MLWAVGQVLSICFPALTSDAEMGKPRRINGCWEKGPKGDSDF